MQIRNSLKNKFVKQALNLIFYSFSFRIFSFNDVSI